ncbi:class I adenylate-forming enzyme family protein [Aliikangiella marina]|uniref:class I adenylate-forming enzyme family protein n=1 Tax=Aliikangiella marina TaxID=1712262 RepID=UPI00163D993B|nr:class I adenylate-forming enzyme family protein [Aliikangiella marina]
MFSITAYTSSRGLISKTIPNGLFEIIEPGKRYCIDLENGLDLALILIEVFKKQAVSVPITPSLTEHQKQYIIEHADVDGVFFRKHGVIKYQPRTSTIKSSKDHRFIIYTSGSTGSPKGVIQNIQAVTHNAEAVSKLHQFSPNQSHATCLPLYHCNALMMSLIGCYLSNCPLVLLSSFEADTYFKLLDAEQVTTASIVPALLEQLLDSKPQWPNQLKYLITAAAPLSKDLAKRFYDQYGPKLRQGYGLSEAVNFSFVMPELTKSLFVKEYLWDYPPVGLPLEGTALKIAADGEVLVQGPNNMQGYWRNEEETQNTISENNWLHTGDIGVLRGNYLVLQGRKKEIINRGGESLHPAELEENFKEQLEISLPFIVVPTKHKALDNEVGVIIDTQNQDSDRLSPSEVTQHFMQVNKIPASVTFKTISRTSTGKPQRIKEGASIFSFQGVSHDILKILWSLKYYDRLKTNEQVSLERCLSQIIPERYRPQISELFNKIAPMKRNNLSEELIISTLKQQVLMIFELFNFPTPSFSENFLERGIVAHKDSGNKIQLGALQNVAVNQSTIDSMNKGDCLVFFSIPKKISSGLNNPIYLLLHKLGNKIASYESIMDQINEMPLNEYSLTISPLKFRRTVLAFIGVINKHE